MKKKINIFLVRLWAVQSSSFLGEKPNTQNHKHNSRKWRNQLTLCTQSWGYRSII